MLYEQIKVVCARRIFAGALPRLIGAAGPVTEGDEYEKSKFRSCYRLPPGFSLKNELVGGFTVGRGGSPGGAAA